MPVQKEFLALLGKEPFVSIIGLVESVMEKKLAEHDARLKTEELLKSASSDEIGLFKRNARTAAQDGLFRPENGDMAQRIILGYADQNLPALELIAQAVGHRGKIFFTPRNAETFARKGRAHLKRCEEEMQKISLAERLKKMAELTPVREAVDRLEKFVSRRTSDGGKKEATSPQPETPAPQLDRKAELMQQIGELNEQKTVAIQAEDFDKAKELKEQITAFEGELKALEATPAPTPQVDRKAELMQQIGELNEQKTAAIQAEDFDKAKELKEQITALEGELKALEATPAPTPEKPPKKERPKRRETRQQPDAPTATSSAKELIEKLQAFGANGADNTAKERAKKLVDRLVAGENVASIEAIARTLGLLHE